MSTERIAGIATNLDGKWMQQMARNLTDAVDGFLRNATCLIHDRDPLFTEAFEGILRERGVKCVRIPARSPNCSPHAERFVKTVRDECLHHWVLFGARHLRFVLKEYATRYPSGALSPGARWAVDRKANGLDDLDRQVNLTLLAARSPPRACRAVPCSRRDRNSGARLACLPLWRHRCGLPRLNQSCSDARREMKLGFLPRSPDGTMLSFGPRRHDAVAFRCWVIVLLLSSGLQK